jgi:hypothetical protein
MRISIATISIFLPWLVYAATSPLQGKWTLRDSSITYKITHTLKTAEGTSHDAKGKGECDVAGKCSFLIAVPVKSFNSGNSNRDLHMIKTVKGATYPMVVVQIAFQIEDLSKPFSTNITMQFAGQKRTVHVEGVQVTRKSSDQVEADLTIPLLLSEFQVERPHLLAVPIQDEVPIHVHGAWIRS